MAISPASSSEPTVNLLVYRLGYFAIARTGPAAGSWQWQRFSMIIPEPDQRFRTGAGHDLAAEDELAGERRTKADRTWNPGFGSRRRPELPTLFVGDGVSRGHTVSVRKVCQPRGRPVVSARR